MASQEPKRDAPSPAQRSSSSFAERNEPSEQSEEPLTIEDMGGHQTPETSPFGHFAIGNSNFQTSGNVSRTSGRLDIVLKETGRGYLAKTLDLSRHGHLHPSRRRERLETVTEKAPAIGEDHPDIRPGMIKRVTTAAGFPDTSQTSIPKLNIVIMVIGSRGDIQPFLKIGKLLKENHGHRVRIATHPAFKDFVQNDIGLEFFSVGGDPAELMAFMVKNPGLIPSVSTIKAGDIRRKRESMYEMFQGFWRACISSGDGLEPNSDSASSAHRSPFVADAIIANPPSFAHIHCAERLGVPLHIMFTFPYTPTQQFPHPLANIRSTNVDANYTNYMSYSLVEMLIFQGLGDLVNRFRVQTLGLEPISTIWSPGQLFRLKVPHTYMWSPGLIPKPVDWGPEIDVAGFVFLDLATSFKPPEDLIRFLDAGEPPVYIGFGSIVVDNPDKFTALIFKAVAKAGVRALVSKGWGGLGDKDSTPDHVYMLENTPHDWLFPRVRAVIHHGGAGTTAIGLKCGKPTMVVPFFGDQPFWGAMVAKASAGAEAPVPYKKLSVDALANGIKQCLSSDAQKNAQRLAESIEAEGDGAQNAIDSFHQHLPLSGEHSIRCSILHDRVAAWALKHSIIRLSTVAAEFLVGQRKVTWKDMRLVRHCDWNDYDGPGEPITGAGQALMSSIATAARGVSRLPGRWWTKSIRQERRRRQLLKEKGTSSRNKEPDLRPSRKQGSVHLRIPQDAMNGQVPKGIVEHRGEESPALSKVPSYENNATDLTMHTTSAFGEAGGALVRAPVDVSHAIAQGFHNAPRLYGDHVRPAPRISGIRSGLRAARREFGFGIYDGVTGVVLQPYHGAKEHGVIGFVEGIGKGIGGFIIKDLAAITAPFGYTLKGLERELKKTSQPTAYLRRARMSQGAYELQQLDFQGRLAAAGKVEAAWKVIVEVRKELDAMKAKGLSGRMEIRRERKRLRAEGAFADIESVERALQERRAKAWLEKQARSVEPLPQRPCNNCSPGDQELSNEAQSSDQGRFHGEGSARKLKPRRTGSSVRFGRKAVIAREKAQEDAEEAHAMWAIRQRVKAIEALGGASAARAVVDGIVREEDSRAALKEDLHQYELNERGRGQDSVDARRDDEEKGKQASDASAKKEENSISDLSTSSAEHFSKTLGAIQKDQTHEEGERGSSGRGITPVPGASKRGSMTSQPPPLSTSSSTTKPSSGLHSEGDTPPHTPPDPLVTPFPHSTRPSTPNKGRQRDTSVRA